MQTLGKKPDVARLTKTTRAYHAGFERSLASFPPSLPVACRVGCSLCCHNWISVTVPEVLLIADGLHRRSDKVVLAEVDRTAEAGMGLDRDQRLEARLACPLYGVHDRCFWMPLKSAGLPCEAYELNHALAFALGHGDPVSAWLEGEGVFTAATPDLAHDGEEHLLLDVLIAGAQNRKLPDNPWVS